MNQMMMNSSNYNQEQKAEEIFRLFCTLNESTRSKLLSRLNMFTDNKSNNILEEKL